MLAVHCMPDHTHLFVGFKPTILISDFVKEIKVETNEFINGKKWVKGKFNWQEGYGVFSYSQSHIDNVIKYIMNQEGRHKRIALSRNIMNSWKNFMYHLKKNIFLSFSINNYIPRLYFLI